MSHAFGVGTMNPSQMGSLSNYNDLSSVESIKFMDEGEARIDAVARQFESLFVSMMLKSMRSANQAFAEGNPLNSKETEFYQDMYDSQLAVSLSSSKGLGIAEVLKSQLMQQQGLTTPQESAAGSSAGYSMAGYERKFFPNVRHQKALDEAVSTIDAQLASMAPEAPANSIDIHVDAHSIRGPEQFIDSLYPLASRVAEETGIDARLMLAQSALETGWGRNQILTEDGKPSFNLFGIKAHRDWDGAQTEILTTEFHGGNPLKTRDSFRVYDSFEDSFRDYAQFLQSNDRYQDALALRDQPKAFAHALQASGYATDPQYGNKIERILDRYWSDSSDAELSDQVVPGVLK